MIVRTWTRVIWLQTLNPYSWRLWCNRWQVNMGQARVEVTGLKRMEREMLGCWNLRYILVRDRNWIRIALVINIFKNIFPKVLDIGTRQEDKSLNIEGGEKNSHSLQIRDYLSGKSKTISWKQLEKIKNLVKGPVRKQYIQELLIAFLFIKWKASSTVLRRKQQHKIAGNELYKKHIEFTWRKSENFSRGYKRGFNKYDIHLLLVWKDLIL